MKCRHCGRTRRAGGYGGDCPCEHCEHLWTGQDESPDGLPHSCSKCGRGYLLSTLPPTGWTTSPPTEPGWYWARGKGVLEVVQVSRYLEHKQIGLPPKPVIVAWVFGDECERELHEWSHWLRIEAPEVPK